MPTTTKLRCAAIAAAAVTALSGAQPAAASRHHRDGPLPCVSGVTCPKPTPCRNADAAPAADNLATIERATLCLINLQRTRHHLSPLHTSHPLRAVARKYAREMVVKHFFDHVTPAGTTFVQRIERSAYLRHATRWSLGENLAWGEGSLATPRAIVIAWMHSPGHRRNILDATFSDAGIGVSLGTPVGDSGATYANEFGHKG